MSGEKEGGKKGAAGVNDLQDERKATTAEIRLSVRSKTHLRNDSSQTVAFAGVSAFQKVALLFDLLYKKCFSLPVSMSYL